MHNLPDSRLSFGIALARRSQWPHDPQLADAAGQCAHVLGGAHESGHLGFDAQTIRSSLANSGAIGNAAGGSHDEGTGVLHVLGNELRFVIEQVDVPVGPVAVGRGRHPCASVGCLGDSLGGNESLTIVSRVYGYTRSVIAMNKSLPCRVSKQARMML